MFYGLKLLVVAVSHSVSWHNLYSLAHNLLYCFHNLYTTVTVNNIWRFITWAMLTERMP